MSTQKTLKRRRNLPSASSILDGDSIRSVGKTFVSSATIKLSRRVAAQPLHNDHIENHQQRLEHCWKSFDDDRVFVSVDEDERRVASVQRLCALLQVYGETEVFGSFAHGTYTQESDVDINVSSNNTRFFDTLRDALTNRIQCFRYIRCARIPLASFVFEKVHFDVTQQLSHGEEMQHHRDVNAFINVYATISSAFKNALKFVKIWARVHALANAHTHTLPSIAYAIMLAATIDEMNEQQRASPALLLLAFFTRYAHIDFTHTLIFAQHSSAGMQRIHEQRITPYNIIEMCELYPDVSSTGYGQNAFIVDCAQPNVNLARFIDDTTRVKLEKKIRAARVILHDSAITQPFEALLNTSKKV